MYILISSGNHVIADNESGLALATHGLFPFITLCAPSAALGLSLLSTKFGYNELPEVHVHVCIGLPSLCFAEEMLCLVGDIALVAAYIFFSC